MARDGATLIDCQRMAEQHAAELDRVATAWGLADQMFEADVRARHAIEETGDRALDAWQRFATRTGNAGLYTVVQQLDRCAFAERWTALRSVFLERGRDGVFEMLMRQRAQLPTPDAEAAELADHGIDAAELDAPGAAEFEWPDGAPAHVVPEP